LACWHRSSWALHVEDEGNEPNVQRKGKTTKKSSKGKTLKYVARIPKHTIEENVWSIISCWELSQKTIIIAKEK